MTENDLGFPRGVRARRLRTLGRRQAERFGARFAAATVTSVTREGDRFCIEGEHHGWRARALILATGVTDVWPPVPEVHRYVGRSLFWCITCDGFRAASPRTLLIGDSSEAATTACQFLAYTPDLLFVALEATDRAGISPEKRHDLKQHGIKVVDGCIDRLRGARGLAREVVVNGEARPAEVIFSLLGSIPNTRLAAQLGVLLDQGGYVRIDGNQRTNVPGLYAAGDVTGPYAHQISSAVHEGAMAAQTANYELYESFHRE